jgi:hypothetical protein
VTGRAGSNVARWPDDVPWSAALVERAIVERFDSAVSGDVRKALGAADDLGPRERLAVIWLSKGDPSALRDMIAAAQLDWRDVLLWAEYDSSAYDKALEARGGFSTAEQTSGESLIRAAMDLPKVDSLNASYLAWVWRLVAATAG